MRKGRNECAITFGFEALEEELSFPKKATLFFSPRISHGPMGVLPSSVTLPWGGSDSFLGICSKIMQKKMKFSSNFMKISAKTTSGL